MAFADWLGALPGPHPFMAGRFPRSAFCQSRQSGGTFGIVDVTHLDIPLFAGKYEIIQKCGIETKMNYTICGCQVFHFGLLLHPHRLSFDWSMDAIRPITSWTDGRNVSALVFYSILIRILSIRKKTTVLPVLLIVIPFLPATNLFEYVGFVAAERLVYLPSAGFCYLIAIGLDASIRRNHRHPIILATAAILCVLSWRTVTRNGDWLNEERLYRSGVAINPPKGENRNGYIQSLIV